MGGHGLFLFFFYVTFFLRVNIILNTWYLTEGVGSWCHKWWGVLEPARTGAQGTYKTNEEASPYLLAFQDHL